jgi:glycosyltransferase involved in cell wall biosynthesis
MFELMIRVAVDVTPLIGARTGVGSFVQSLVHEVGTHHEISLRPFAVTWRGRSDASMESTGLSPQHGPMPARLLRSMWRHSDHPRIERWMGSVDIVHGTNYVVPPSTVAELVSVHDITMVRFPELCTNDTLQYPAMLRSAMQRGAHVHTDSQYVADEVIGYFGWPPDRVHVVSLSIDSPRHKSNDRAECGGYVKRPNVENDQRCGADQERWRMPNAAADRNEFDFQTTGLPNGVRCYVLALGTIEPRKDFPNLLRAFSLFAGDLPNVDLVIAGGDGWGVEAFEQTLNSLNPQVRKRVHRLGFVGNEQRAALLQYAAAFAYPSIYEGFGIPPLEAMRDGTPVVTTNAGSLPEVLGGAACFVPPGDSASLANALQLVLTDSALRERMRADGYTQAARYSAERMGNEFVELYKKLAMSDA